MQDHLQEDPAHLLLKYSPSHDLDLKEAVRQIAARQKARGKLPTWVNHPRVIFPASLSLEQSSSELTAKFKSRFLQGATLLDLTGGLGVDTLIMGKKFQEVLYIERNVQLSRIAAHNFSLLSQTSSKFQVKSTDSLEYLKNTDRIFDWLYADPDRRGLQNQKYFRLDDCEPNIPANWHLLKNKADNIMVKASPMLDVKAVIKALPDVRQVLVVAVKNEVKEVLLLWKKHDVGGTVKISAYDLGPEQEQRFDFTFEAEEESPVRYEMPSGYLLEPNAAILKAGAFKSFASHHGLAKLHPNTHLYTLPEIRGEIPGRVFRIFQEVKLDKKVLKQLFPSGMVNVLVRNHPLKAQNLKKKYGLKDGGKEFLIATTTKDGKARAFWCGRMGEEIV